MEESVVNFAPHRSAKYQGMGFFVPAFEIEPSTAKDPHLRGISSVFQHMSSDLNRGFYGYTAQRRRNIICTLLQQHFQGKRPVFFLAFPDDLDETNPEMVIDAFHKCVKDAMREFDPTRVIGDEIFNTDIIAWLLISGVRVIIDNFHKIRCIANEFQVS